LLLQQEKNVQNQEMGIITYLWELIHFSRGKNQAEISKRKLKTSESFFKPQKSSCNRVIKLRSYIYIGLHYGDSMEWNYCFVEYGEAVSQPAIFL
jgi:hypothetical protein